MKKLLSILMVAALVVAFQVPAFAVTSFQDQGTYEGDFTTVNLGTGLSGSASGSVYTISGGAVGTDGNWTGDGVTTTLDAAPTKFIATHSTGTFYATLLEAGTGDIKLENAQTIDGGTNNKILFGDNSDTLTVEFDGTDVKLTASDGTLIISSAEATDGWVEFQVSNDSDDYIIFKTVSNVPQITTGGAANLNIISSGGTIDFTSQILTTTGTLSAGATTATSFIVGDDTIDVVTDDEMRFASNDANSTIEAYGFEAKDGILLLTADQSDDNADEFAIISQASTNNLLFQNDTSGSLATILTLTSAGVLTSTGDIEAVNDTATTNAVVDAFTVRASSTGTPATGLGVGIEFDVEDAGGIEQQGSIDVALTTITDGSEDADMIFSQNINGTITETIRINADTGLDIVGANMDITLPDGETINNDTDDIVVVTSNDSAIVFTLLAADASDGDATLSIEADASADNGDVWQISHDGATNQLLFFNNTSGAQIAKGGFETDGSFMINGPGPNYATDTASDDTYLIAPAPAITAYALGQMIMFRAVTANTGACTVNVNSLGAKSLLSLNDVTPPDNYIEAGSMVVAVYNGAEFEMIQPDANPA